MADIMIGSARLGENGKITGGAAGDQKQTRKPDMAGEVSMQKMYNHSKGWIVLRPKDGDVANTMATLMTQACNNENIGYDQSNRYGIIEKGIGTMTPTECDCSSLVREVIREATNRKLEDFNTGNEKEVLLATGLFKVQYEEYVSQSTTPVCNGDVLVTRTKGHTAIVTGGNPRNDDSGNQNSGDDTGKKKPTYFAKYTGNKYSIVDALVAVGVTDTSITHRTKIAEANEISGYTGTVEQNDKLLKLLKEGKLLRA
jgi:hypothetical protein